MSSSTHGRTRQFIGRIEVPSKLNIPCFDIQTIIDEVDEIDLRRPRRAVGAELDVIVDVRHPEILRIVSFLRSEKDDAIARRAARR